METDERGRKVDESRGNKRLSESPPDDDCCPICFGSFTVPCRSNCGHWYCGNFLKFLSFFFTNLFGYYSLMFGFVWLNSTKKRRGNK